MSNTNLNTIKKEDLQPGFIFWKNGSSEPEFIDCYMLTSDKLEYDYVQSTNSAWDRRYGTDQSRNEPKSINAYFSYCGGKFSGKRDLKPLNGYFVKKHINDPNIYIFEYSN